MTASWLLLATLLSWWHAVGALVPRAAPVPADSCAPPAAAGPESLLAAGRFWHASRVAPAVPAAPHPVPLRVALLRLAIGEGLGRMGTATGVLARVRGADTAAELLALAARDDGRAGRWGAAAAGDRRLAALPGARPAERAAGAVRLAVALGELHETDSAAAAWSRAALLLPDLADWLAIRRAALDPDTTSAFAAMADARTPGAAEFADSLVAERREAAGNLRGALAVYLRRGRVLDAARVEIQLGHADVARARVGALLTADPSRPVALLAASFIVDQWSAPTAEELTAIARAYRARGDARSAQRYLERLVAARDTSAVAWLELAQVAAARHRIQVARSALAHARERLRQRPDAAALEAKATAQVLGSQGRWLEADSLVAGMAQTFPGDTGVAAAALMLADHERWQGTSESERPWYELLVRLFGATPAANVARFRLALMAYAAGFADSAATGVAAALAGDSAHRLGPAPRYWAARLAFERHETAGADTLRRIAAEDPTGYYGVRARELVGDSLPLGPDSLLPSPAPGGFSPTRAADRIELLAAAGLTAEARAEAVAWIRDTSASPQLLTAAAAAATRAGFAQEAIFLGLAARSRGPITRGVAEALFPLPFRPVITAEAAEQCVDPMLLAAIVRQESRFQPKARSRVGARGLSQLLPVTARQMSRRFGPWDPSLLDVPDFNLHFGARYLRDRIARDSVPLYAVVASYDAGPQHLARWRAWPEMRDADLFVERLPIAETRDYVRSVYANHAWYRRVYGAGTGPG